MLVITLTGFFKTIILLGIVQGLIVGCLLYNTKTNHYANKLLASLIWAISLASINLYGNYQNWFDADILRFIAQITPLVVPMIFGPLIYFYVQALLDPNFRITKKRKLHFLPVIIDLVPSITVFIYLAGRLLKQIPDKPGPWGAFIDDYNVYADIPRWISVSVYVLLAAKFLKQFRLKEALGIKRVSLQTKWLRQFIGMFIVFQGIWLLYLIPYEIPRYTNLMLDTFDWYPLYIPMAVLIYWMGIKGLMVSSQAPAASEKKLNANAPLTEETIKKVLDSFQKVMKEDQIYLNPDLNLSLLAEKIGFPQKTISAVLNQHLQKSFTDCVNEYRVEAFKIKILLPEMNHLTIAGIAQECGFSSLPTFQRTFKELTGTAPSVYRKSALQAG